MSKVTKNDKNVEPKFEDAFENERMLKMQSTGPDKKYDLQESSASCKISDI